MAIPIHAQGYMTSIDQILKRSFPKSFRWPKCYHAEMNQEKNETQIWMEYIDGISGLI